MNGQMNNQEREAIMKDHIKPEDLHATNTIAFGNTQAKERRV